MEAIACTMKPTLIRPLPKHGTFNWTKWTWVFRLGTSRPTDSNHPNSSSAYAGDQGTPNTWRERQVNISLEFAVRMEPYSGGVAHSFVWGAEMRVLITRDTWEHFWNVLDIFLRRYRKSTFTLRTGPCFSSSSKSFLPKSLISLQVLKFSPLFNPNQELNSSDSHVLFDQSFAFTPLVPDFNVAEFLPAGKLLELKIEDQKLVGEFQEKHSDWNQDALSVCSYVFSLVWCSF